MCELCTALITKLPIRSHNHSANRKNNPPLQRDPQAAIDSIIFTSRESGSLHDNCNVTLTLCYCMWSAGAESVMVSMEDLTFAGQRRLHFCFPITSSRFLMVRPPQTSGRSGCIRGLTGGRLHRPQSWPDHLSEYTFQLHPGITESHPSAPSYTLMFIAKLSTTLSSVSHWCTSVRCFVLALSNIVFSTHSLFQSLFDFLVELFKGVCIEGSLCISYLHVILDGPQWVIKPALWVTDFLPLSFAASDTFNVPKNRDTLHPIHISKLIRAPLCQVKSFSSLSLCLLWSCFLYRGFGFLQMMYLLNGSWWMIALHTRNILQSIF